MTRNAGAPAPAAGVVARYREALESQGFVADSAQEAAVLRLQRMHDELVAFKARRSGRIRRLVARPPVPRGIWLHGGVGRGKSFLMDCFYAAVPVVRKTRIHFHEFMRGVHRELERLKGMADPLDEVARRIARRYRLVCFDEFHVSDIADAMILERLMRGLFANGVTFVITSNYAPDGLYPDGLHRDRILPAIGLLNARLDVLSVDSGVDYRRRSLEQADVYVVMAGSSADAQLQLTFARLGNGVELPTELMIENRTVRAMKVAAEVAWFDFATLCGGPRSQNDYLWLARRFDTILVSDVPRMSAAMSSEARRFVWLVDVLYDQRVKLVISAECVPEQLYVAGPMSGEFHRTVSRLVEMQSREYLDAPRRARAESLT